MTTQADTPSRTIPPVEAPAPAESARPPLPRLVRVELRKMYDTRAGGWLMASIVLAALVASAAVVAFAPDATIVYSTFAQAIGFPMAVILPIVAILAVTGEYSQRSALTTFALVPRRGRIVAAKALAVLLSALAAVAVTFAVGALGNLAGSALHGLDPVWDVTAEDAASVLLGTLLSIAMGFAIGVLIRNSAGAVVAYFVWSLVLPPAFMLLAAYQSWFADAKPWIDFNANVNAAYEAAGRSSDYWGQLAVSSVPWLVLPLALGVWRILRTEVK